MGLQASGATTASMSEVDKRQLVSDQLSKDPSGRLGFRTVTENIAFDTGTLLTQYVFLNKS